jgi:hypothetical protein
LSTIRTLAAHQVVQFTHPRPIREEDRIGLATGKAIDGALSQFSHEFSRGHRPTASAALRLASQILHDELLEAEAELGASDREKIEAQMAGVLQAFRRSPLFGLARPRSRLILIGEEVGIYAQPDFWDGRLRFYEMKSYRAIPHPPDVELQLQLFRLAFPGFEAYLACFERRSLPVETTLELLPKLTESEAADVLRLAYELGLEHGVPKVAEYLDASTIRYPKPTARP